MKQNMIVGGAALVALLIGVWASVTIAPPATPQYAQLYPQPRALHNAQLLSHNGELIDNKWFQGKWTLVFLGFTWCPDICPTTLAELKRIYPQLQQFSSDHPVQVLFVSVDPKRDTQARLKEYIEFFNDKFYAATAEHSVLFPLVRSMGMAYAIADSTDNPDYLIDHSASVVVVNPDANMVGRFKPAYKPGEVSVSDGEQILSDLPIMIAQYR